MNMTVLIIAMAVNGELHIEQAYPMENFAECESVAEHRAVLESYPERVLYCMDAAMIHESVREKVQVSSGLVVP